jgi:hypothetical protein
MMPTPTPTQMLQINDGIPVSSIAQEDIPVTQGPQANDDGIAPVGTMAQEGIPVTQGPQANDDGIVAVGIEDIPATQVPQSNNDSYTVHFV